MDKGASFVDKQNGVKPENLRISFAKKQGRIRSLTAFGRYQEAAFRRREIRQPPSSYARNVMKKMVEEKVAKDHVGDPIYIPGAGLASDVGSGAKPSWRDPQPMALLMKRLVRDKGWNEKVEVASLSVRWSEIVGPNIAKNTRVESFTDDGVLTIRTSSTSWAVQLRVYMATIQKNIAEIVGEGVVKSIDIKGPTQRSWKHGKYSVPGRGPRDTYG
ncbi:DciA family protein [Actinotignum urinale]|uniref:DUF721 domain-containing protein n=1 Tax=Actinotignum urinale TaxID=190146 RepID=UPI002A7FC8E4|nr:DciA family protein [Actinotignum urinale]MDY5151191.1 DciA family protein [Actinotignum urinale]